MELVDIERKLENLGCNVLLWNSLRELSFHRNIGDGLLTGVIQESGMSYLISLNIAFFVSMPDEESHVIEEKLFELEVSKPDISKVLGRVEHIITHLNERFSREEQLLETLPSDIKDVNDVKVDVLSKLSNVFSTLGVVFDCEWGHFNRKGMINLYVEFESISNASVVVKISYAGALKYQRYIDATNVYEEIKNIEKCVEVFKENFIDSQTLLNELENF